MGSGREAEGGVRAWARGVVTLLLLRTLVPPKSLAWRNQAEE